MDWQSKIVDREMGVSPERLLAHPDNWRIHTDNQKALMSRMLGGLGWVGWVRVNKNTNRIIDGHMRVTIAYESGETVPVMWLDLTDEEERFALLTVNPTAEMAGLDGEKFNELVKGMAAEETGLEIVGEMDKRGLFNAAGYNPMDFGKPDDDGWGDDDPADDSGVLPPDPAKTFVIFLQFETQADFFTAVGALSGGDDDSYVAAQNFAVFDGLPIREKFIHVGSEAGWLSLPSPSSEKDEKRDAEENVTESPLPA